VHIFKKQKDLSQINDLMLHLKLLEKDKQANPKKKHRQRNNKNKG
jgi:hypothetical protein